MHRGVLRKKDAYIPVGMTPDLVVEVCKQTRLGHVTPGRPADLEIGIPGRAGIAQTGRRRGPRGPVRLEIGHFYADSSIHLPAGRRDQGKRDKKCC